MSNAAYAATATFVETAYLSVSGRADSVRTVLNGWTFWRRFGYTAAGLVDSIWGSGPSGAFLNRRYGYNTSRGTLDSLRFGPSWTKFVWDGELGLEKTSPPGSLISRWFTSLHGPMFIYGAPQSAIGYDTAGRISRHFRVSAPGNPYPGSLYGYDGLGRLVAESLATTVPNYCDYLPDYGFHCPSWTVDSVRTFTYDSAGNRRDHGGTYLPGNRITAFDGCSYTTDADGNVTSRTCGSVTTTFFWSAENRLDSTLVGSAITRYAYDGRGRLLRIQNDTSTRYLLWAGWSAFAKLSGAGMVLEEYSYYEGLDRLHAVATGGATYYAHPDGRGSVLGLWDSLLVGFAYATDVWGNPMPASSDSWWKGALYMGSGLYYMRARWYEAKTGRFLSEDPLGLAGGINQYVYAGNDPVNGIDPFGLGPCWWELRGGVWILVCDVDPITITPSPEPAPPWAIPHGDGTIANRIPSLPGGFGMPASYGRYTSGMGRSVLRHVSARVACSMLGLVPVPVTLSGGRAVDVVIPGVSPLVAGEGWFVGTSGWGRYRKDGFGIGKDASAGVEGAFTLGSFGGTVIDIAGGGAAFATGPSFNSGSLSWSYQYGPGTPGTARFGVTHTEPDYSVRCT